MNGQSDKTDHENVFNFIMFLKTTIPCEHTPSAIPTP